MNCEQTEKLALLRRSGEASAEQLAQLVEHLLSCSECCKKITAIEDTLRRYHQHKTRQALALPAGLRARVILGAGKTRRETRKKTRILWIPLPAAVLAVAAGVLFIFLLIVPKPAKQNASSSRQAYIAVFEDAKTLELVNQAQGNIDSANTVLAVIGQPPASSEELNLERENKSFLDTVNDLARELENIETVWNSGPTI